MSDVIPAIRGMNDILPEQTTLWRAVESRLFDIIQRFGYQEIRLPIVEHTALFERSIGEVTDIVEKEMYTFADRNQDSLTLRPEGTAGCVRACLQHGLLNQGAQRLWYYGPMFRHERPQQGRYRQFYQVGVEAFGMAGADIEAELIRMTYRCWQALGVADQLQLQINTLGTAEIRQTHRTQLVAYFTEHRHLLDEDSQRRLTTNPLRILDSKNPALAECIANAPSLLDYLDAPAAEHFACLQTLLTAADIPFTVNSRLVRGLDYYTHTVFEWVTDALGAQGTVCAGGRYDKLVDMLHGPSTPAVGFALGLERLMLLCQQQQTIRQSEGLTVYVVMAGDAAQLAGHNLADQLRQHIPQLVVIAHCGGGSFKSQFKKADRSGARLALILGEEEVSANTVGIKWLREQREQQTLPQAELLSYICHVTEERQ
jgi:histidyl-tRNA synthetase